MIFLLLSIIYYYSNNELLIYYISLYNSLYNDSLIKKFVELSFDLKMLQILFIMDILLTVRRHLKLMLFIPSFLSITFIFDNMIINIGISDDPIFLASISIIGSLYVGAWIFFYLLFNTAILPPAKPYKIKVNVYNVSSLLFGIILTLAIMYIINPYILEIFNIFEDKLNIFFISIIYIHLFYVIFIAVGIILSHFNAKHSNYNPSITVMIPAHNEERFIRRCIESVDSAARNYKGYVKILVIDDSSTDSTNYIANKTLSSLKYSKGELLSYNGRKKAAALNYGLKYVDTELIFVLDADSIIDKDALNVSHYFVDKNVGAVGIIIYPIMTNSILQKMLMLELLIVFRFLRKGLEGYDSITVVSGAASVFRREALLKIGGWSEIRHGEDADITLRIGYMGYNIIQDITKPLVYSDAPYNLEEWLKQRISWARGFFYNYSINRMMIGRSIRGFFIMPLKLERVYMTLISPMLIIYILVSVSESVFIEDVVIEKLSSITLFFLLVIIPLLAYNGLWKFLPYVILYPLYNILRVYTAIVALLTILEQNRY